MEGHVFEPLPLLQSVNLEDNMLTKLQNETFQTWHGLQFLTNVDLGHNPLEDFNDQALLELVSLQSLDIGGTNASIPLIKSIMMSATTLKKLILPYSIACCLCEAKKKIETLCNTIRLNCGDSCDPSSPICAAHEILPLAEEAFIKALQSRRKTFTVVLHIEPEHSLSSNNEDNVELRERQAMTYPMVQINFNEEINLLDGPNSLLPPNSSTNGNARTIQAENRRLLGMLGLNESTKHSLISRTFNLHWANKDDMKKLMFLGSLFSSGAQQKEDNEKKNTSITQQNVTSMEGESLLSSNLQQSGEDAAKNTSITQQNVTSVEGKSLLSSNLQQSGEDAAKNTSITQQNVTSVEGESLLNLSLQQNGEDAAKNTSIAQQNVTSMEGESLLNLSLQQNGGDEANNTNITQQKVTSVEGESLLNLSLQQNGEDAAKNTSITQQNVTSMEGESLLNLSLLQNGEDIAKNTSITQQNVTSVEGESLLNSSFQQKGEDTAKNTSITQQNVTSMEGESLLNLSLQQNGEDAAKNTSITQQNVASVEGESLLNSSFQQKGEDTAKNTSITQQNVTSMEGESLLNLSLQQNGEDAAKNTSITQQNVTSVEGGSLLNSSLQQKGEDAAKNTNITQQNVTSVEGESLLNSSLEQKGENAANTNITQQNVSSVEGESLLNSSLQQKGENAAKNTNITEQNVTSVEGESLLNSSLEQKGENAANTNITQQNVSSVEGESLLNSSLQQKGADAAKNTSITQQNVTSVKGGSLLNSSLQEKGEDAAKNTTITQKNVTSVEGKRLLSSRLQQKRNNKAKDININQQYFTRLKSGNCDTKNCEKKGNIHLQAQSHLAVTKGTETKDMCKLSSKCKHGRKKKKTKRTTLKKHAKRKRVKVGRKTEKCSESCHKARKGHQSRKKHYKRRKHKMIHDQKRQTNLVKWPAVIRVRRMSEFNLSALSENESRTEMNVASANTKILNGSENIIVSTSTPCSSTGGTVSQKLVNETGEDNLKETSVFDQKQNCKELSSAKPSLSPTLFYMTGLQKSTKIDELSKNVANLEWRKMVLSKLLHTDSIKEDSESKPEENTRLVMLLEGQLASMDSQKEKELSTVESDLLEKQLNVQLRSLIPNKAVRALICHVIRILKMDCLKPNLKSSCAKLVSETGLLMRTFSKRQHEKVWKNYINDTLSAEASKGYPGYGSKLLLAILVTVIIIIIIGVICLVEICSHRRETSREEKEEETSSVTQIYKKVKLLVQKKSSDENNLETFASATERNKAVAKPLWLQDLYVPLDSVRRKNMAQGIHGKDSTEEEEEEEIFNKAHLSEDSEWQST
ncbi:uncharacterized protein LOC115074498 isoform X3 [Rhinatrema bivittatum]|nr:uncharacterized protein LOC115074498 isoform X3 [Rhinatrema bivittatum]